MFPKRVQITLHLCTSSCLNLNSLELATWAAVEEGGEFSQHVSRASSHITFAALASLPGQGGGEGKC